MKITTPICDFLTRYADQDVLRLHMPGHKGNADPNDITEIDGADSLYEAAGIIRESEQNAGDLFGCHTFYSTEGSSHGIRAMLYLVSLYAKEQGRRCLIAAGRNGHKTFVTAAALLDMDVTWLYPENRQSYLSCNITAEELEQWLANTTEKPVAVYLTTPDYLGNCIGVRELARVCHRHDVLVLVDNAHGAYLRFITPSRHPMDEGADMCCDSAHKTLSVLTGGAYMHVSRHAPPFFVERAKEALSVFGSTSPSYLILQSLDKANRRLADTYREELTACVAQLNGIKARLSAHGYRLQGNEPLKLTLSTRPYGYDGRDFARLLAEKGLMCEFADPDFVVMMITPEIRETGLRRTEEFLLSLPSKLPLTEIAPPSPVPLRVISLKEALLAPREIVPVSKSVGRTLASPTVGCPPAVPIVVSGERIDEAAVNCFKYYNIKTCTVIKER